jgi:A/G-specific adenine glycosylase
MLQQTQVLRVEEVYKRFIREFPSLEELSQASNRHILLAWRGMGYNSRALRLRDAAHTIMMKYHGEFPRSMEELQSIKGIGHYTAAAIRNFAFNLSTPCLDTNIRRILHRVFFGPEKRDGTWKVSDKNLVRVAEEVLADATKKKGTRSIPLDARNWHAALMDFGSLVCTKRGPKCAACPLRSGLCKAAFKVELRKIPQKMKKEPGREIAGKFVPNRIIRGRIVEFLRDEDRSVAWQDIGANVCIDWSLAAHGKWLKQLLEKLEGEGMIASDGGGYLLAD